MSHPALALCVLVGLAALVALGLLFWNPEPAPRPPPRPPASPRAEPSTDIGQPPPAPADVPPSPTPEDAPEPDAAPPPMGLREALLLADRDARSDGELLEARRYLEQILRRDPSAARVLAEVLGKLESRGLGFQLSRLLGRYLDDPAVRGPLLALIEGGPAVGREMALYSVLGRQDDPELAEAVAEAFLADAESPVRTAAACCLVEMLPALPEADRERVRHTARDLVSGSGADELRAEAVDLLDPGANAGDAAQLRGVLHAGPHTSPKLRLAAARALLTHGTPLAEVRPALEDLASGDGPAAAALEAILEELSGP